MLFDVTNDSSTASVHKVVTLIECSQALATRVLVLANSAAYGLMYKVTNLHQAVAILGTAEIRILTVLVGLSSFINNTKLPSGFNSVGIWRHQLKVANIAKTLAEHVKRTNSPTVGMEANASTTGVSAEEQELQSIVPSDVYIIGLLHDIGQFFFAARRPDLWEQVESLRVKENLRFVDAENKFWGIDHALIGAAVLHTWHLPHAVTDPINWHHTPELASLYTVKTRLLAAANQIAHDGLGENDCLPDEVMPLLPQKTDPRMLGAAIAVQLTENVPNSLAGLVVE